MNGYGLDPATAAEQVAVIAAMTPDQAEVVLHLTRKLQALVEMVGESIDYRLGNLTEPKRR